MSCVNKASLQFKDCCKRLDLSEQQLEQIVYDYTNQLGNENTFPTDTYIEQLLRGIPISELSDSQRELYKLKYEESQPLDTFELAQQRVLELQQYYPDDRIKTIQRNNGKYQVVVNTDYSQIETEQEINQIKKEAIANGTFGKVKNKEGQLVDSILFNTLGERAWLQVRTKAFKDWFGDWELAAYYNNIEKAVTNETLLSEFVKYFDSSIVNKDNEKYTQKLNHKHLSILADLIRTIDKTNETKIKVKFYDESKFKAGYGFISQENGDIYLPDRGNNGLTDEDIQTFVHEFAHHITLDSYFKNDKFRREVASIRQTLVDSLKERGLNNRLQEYGFKNDAEFIAEAFSNSSFQQLLKDCPSKNKIKKQSLWSKFVQAIKEIVNERWGGGKNYNTLLDDIFELIENNVSNYTGNHYIANASKVVDENGEPLQVYHHTDNPNLTEFSTDFENYFAKDGGTKEAVFFDENKTGTLNRKYDIPVFLNIRELNEYNETKQQLHDRGTTYREVVNQSAEKNNKDGGVHMKDFDDNKMEHQSIWIVHNPNQIKSATDNIGTFSTQSNNIKLQRLPNNTRREYLLDKLKSYYSQQDYVRDLILRDLGMFLATHRGFSLKKFGTQEIRNFEKTSNIDNEVKLYTLLLRLAYGIAIYEPYVKKHPNGKVTVITTFRTLDNLIDYFYNNRVSMFNDLSLLDLESEYNRLILEDEIQENLNEFNRFYINPKKKDEIYNNLLKKAIIEAEAINTSMEYLESLPNTQEDNAFVADCIRFIKNGSIVNFEMYGLQVREVWDYLRKRHYDISSIRNTVQLFLTYANFTLKSVKDNGETLTREKIEQRFDKFTFSGTAVTTNGEELEIYDVEDSQEGQQQVCLAIADTAPKKEDGKPIYGCPWCIATFNYDPKTKKVTPTAGAYETYWMHYNQGKRQIAFHNGKPVAFNSSKHQENEWWDFFDGRDNGFSGYSDIKDINVSNRLKKLDLEGNDFLHFKTEGVLMYYRGNTLEEIDVLLNNLLKLGISKAGYSYSNRYSNDLRYKSIRGLEFLYNGDYLSYTNNSNLEASLDSRNAFGSDKIINTLEITSPELFSALEIKSLLYTPIIQITSYDNNYFYYIKIGGKDINIKVDSDTADLLKASYDLLLELKKSADTFNEELTKLIEKGVYTTEKDLYDYLLKSNYLEKLNKIQETLNQVVEQVNKNQEAIDWVKSQVEIEKQREENKKKRKEVISSIRKNKQRREALDLALEYAQENEYSDSDEDLTQLRSDHQNEYDEALKDEENSIQDIDLTLGLGVSKSLAEMYNEGIRKPFNKELSKKLRDILSKYHFEFLDDADMSYFGDNVLGATDMLQKIIYLASENNRNAITEPEEFAHSFITMMGAKYRRPENRDKHPEAKLFSELRDLVEKTSLYQLVYDTYKDIYTYKNGRPNFAAIKEEALGQALAAVLLNREEQYEGDKTFFAKVKRWLQKVIRNIRIQLRRKTKVGEKLISVERALQDELTNIADSILDGSYKKKYLDKINPKGYNRVDLAQSLQYDREHNNGRIIDFMHTVNDLGGMIDGSLAYRGQGTVYRKSIDTLHDIDITVPLNIHGLLDRFPSIASNSLFAPEQRFWGSEALENAITQTRFYTELQRRTAQPIHFIAAFTSGENVIANLMICDDDALVERFKNLTGNYNDRLDNFTEEERQKMYLVDLFFINRNENRIYQDTESNITFSEYTVPFEAKLKMSRAKDLFDYQNFNPAFRHYYGKRDVRMLKLPENQQPQQLLQDATSTQELDVLAMSNETAYILNQIPYTDASSVGVQVVTDIKTSYASWLQLSPNGIVAYRIGYNTFNSRQAVELGIIGNPFDWNNPKYGHKAGDLFLDWLLTGNNHGEEKANEDFRLAIISRIKSSPKDTKIAYYTANPLGNSHATTLGYLIQHPELLDTNTINNQLPTQQTQQPVTFTESTGNYPQRTRENADWSDITIALAVDFTTAGETLTAQQAGSRDERFLGERKPREGVEDKYVPATIDPRISLDNLVEGIAANIFEQLDDKGKTKNLKLNIAGNGIYTLSNNYTQEQINNLVYKVLRKLLLNGITISEIRSGGQTGVDEAGIIAAQRLGIPSSVNAPKGFTFRDVNGEDHSNREEFVARFLQPVQQQNTSQEEYIPNNPAYREEPDLHEVVFSKQDAEQKKKDWIELYSDVYGFTPELVVITVEKGDGENTDDVWHINVLKSEQPTLDEQQPLEGQTQEPSYEERQFAISEQVSNLINNDRGLKATELRQLSELMVYWMSEFISDCLDNPEKIFQILGITDYSNSDIEKVTLMSRKQIVQMIGVENMFNLCKSYVLTPDIDGTGKGNANINSRALRRQAELLKNNFQGLMQFSTSVWSTLEDFSIGLTETGYDTLETSNPDAFLDEEQIKERDKQADGESTLESWLVESNTIDALTTATLLVKRELLHCYLYENTGEVDDLGKPIKRIKTNKFGINERLNPREAINAIIKWVLGCWDLNSMVAALKEHQDKNPWVEQLVNKLSDISGNESDFQSQFFSCMCRSFQLYGVVNENDKRELYQHSINKNPMLLMAFNGIKDLYKVGEHPLLKLDGIDRKAFKEFHEDVEQLINFSKNKYSEIENIDELNTLISHVYMLLGYYDATPEVVGAAMSDMTFKTLVQNLLTLRTYLDNEKLNKLYNPFDFKANNSIISTLQNILKPITYIMDDYAITQFFESGNMRQSNVIPSFMTKLFSKMQLPLKEFEEFVEKEYGQFDWFYDKKLKKYKNEWLSRLVRMPEEERKKLFEHKVQLSFNKKQYMRGMTDSEYAVSVISEYFTAGKLTAWYKVPIMSNKPTSEFIKFIKYDDSDYKDRIVVGMQHIFVLELGRIQTIIKRQNAGINKSDPRFIKNFDKNGVKFCFLDFLNPFLNENKNTELGRLLNIKINGTRELSTEENARLNNLVKQEIRNSMEARVQQIMESWRQQGILTAVSLIQGFERKPEKAEDNWESAANNAKIENFIWNDTFAAMEILLLTITDVAQYKDAEDLQKRLAQIHAPGVRGNIQARDYFGNQVSDGTHRAIYLTDFDDFISNVIDNVTKVFDKKIAEAPENEKALWKSLKESLVGKDGAYRQINVADALAYACPTSYRKKAYMFGKWSREKEKMYQLLMSGQYDFSTLKQAFGEPLKPFLYSYEEVDAGVENSPIETFKIGVQNKDSEYLLIMADALTRNEYTGIPNILRAIYDVMEESHKVKNENGRYIAATDGIDDIQFESTVKAGLYGRINLKQFSTDPQGEANAKNELRSKIFDGLGDYNSTYIHETRYEDYCIQQEVPEHFKDHSQAHGSQIRYIIPSDLPLTNANNETVVYSYFDPATGTERKLDAKQFKAEYENHCAANIQESLDLLKEEFGLVTPDGQISFDRKQMNQTLSEILKREILSSPRYGIDMLLACSLNADGEFNIPLGDPIQSRRIEQLINSIIKNRINKQKIAGGPVVQVTTFGTSRDLNIRFKSNKGGLLMTRKEFEKSKEEGTYEEYIEKYLDGIAYYEIYAPMYTNELFQQFADRDGNIDIKRIEKENPELLKIIGYRIPTEDKYSCFPAKIVGFLPREAGDAVMLPADITAITGSDFDVDKMYLMRKEFKEEKKSKKEITKELEAVLLKGLTGKAKDVTQKQIEDFMNLREGEKESAIRNNISNPIVKAYANMSKKRFVEYTEGRQYHNNMIIDMSYSVLTNKEIAYLVLNPGGFDLQKRMGYAIAAYKDPEVRSKYTFEQLMEMPIDKGEVNLKSLCYKNKNLAFFDTQVQFYKQNSAAGMILGMFAVLKIAHAVLESDGFGIDLGKVFIDKNTNEQIPFGFCGIPFLGIVEVDKRFDANNQLIGKTLGSLVASAADAVKDPVLNLNNINNQTANVLTTMLRLGIVYEDAALLLSLPAITKILLEHSKRMVNKEFISLNALIKSRMLELDDKYYMSESEKVQSEPLSREDLIRGFSEEDTIEAEKLEWKVLNAYLKFDQMSLIIKGLTNATRYNSVSNAVGPLIIDNLIMEYKAGKFSEAITYNGIEAKGINSVFSIHPILDKFSLATIIARRLLGEMPAYSSDFRILVNNSGDYTLSKIMGDRKLFSKLSDFYQSYLLVLAGFINPKEREYYIDKFPIEFMKAKENYSDNPFVLAIRLSTGTFGGKTKGILTLDSVGMEQMLKDKLSSGWADLYKENPELAKKLFIYNFFKGGLGFSPKTFMNLVPISMKESIENNGIKYVDVFRHIPSLGNYSMIFDLFVGNNVGDFKLVPQRNPYSEHQNILGNRIIITTKFENYELDYFKVKGFNNIYRIFKLLLVDPVTKRKIFVEIPVLGNQGEFFDVSATPINKSNVTNNILEEEGFEPFDEEIVSEEGYDPYYIKIAIDIIKNEKGLKDTKEAYETLKSSRKTQEGLSLQEAEQRKAKIREAIMNSLKRRNITFNEEELNKTTNEFC